MITKERLKEIANAQPVQEYDTAYVTLGDVKEIAQELLSARKAVQTLNSLRKLMGYVQNGSDETVSLFQDDATMDFIYLRGKPRPLGRRISTRPQRSGAESPMVPKRGLPEGV